MRTAFAADVVRRLSWLRSARPAGVPNAAIDLDAAVEYGFTVCGTTGWAGPVSTVEHASP